MLLLSTNGTVLYTLMVFRNVYMRQGFVDVVLRVRLLQLLWLSYPRATVIDIGAVICGVGVTQ